MRKTLTRLRRARLRGLVGGLLVSLLIFGCTHLRKPPGPIPVKELPAPRRAAKRPLVIVLPGRGDDLSDLDRAGIAQAVQRGWPEADVLLAGLGFPYYADGKVAERLHDEVIAPARSRGHREIWLTGASLGAMGALLYERRYPRDVTGLVLYAPFMGNPGTIREVQDAGGPKNWDPGPPPETTGPDGYARELWRVVKGWQDPEEARRVWLVTGDQDRFIDSTRLMVELLPRGHYLEVPGGHDWPVWDAGAEMVFKSIAAADRP